MERDINNGAFIRMVAQLNQRDSINRIEEEEKESNDQRSTPVRGMAINSSEEGNSGGSN